MVADRVTLVCTECRKKQSGREGDSHRGGCSFCGGQLREIRYGTQARRRRTR